LAETAGSPKCLRGAKTRGDRPGRVVRILGWITSSTFATVPDVPVGNFELTLPEGPDSALAANGNLCGSKLVMPTEFLAQNGAQIKQDTKIAVTGCKPALRIKRHKVPPPLRLAPVR
jgi:hypothetical protein